jgi:predicted nuclease of predicted toxin-antitoxin system
MLHFLVDASLPKPTASVIIAAGHLATDVRDIGMGTAIDSAIAAHARSRDFTLLSVDLDFANIIEYPPADYRGIAVLRPPENATRAVVLSMIAQFLQTSDVIAALPGRLAIVEPGRIRLRPVP